MSLARSVKFINLKFIVVTFLRIVLASAACAFGREELIFLSGFVSVDHMVVTTRPDWLCLPAKDHEEHDDEEEEQAARHR